MATVINDPSVSNEGNTCILCNHRLVSSQSSLKMPCPAYRSSILFVALSSKIHLLLMWLTEDLRGYPRKKSLCFKDSVARRLRTLNITIVKQLIIVSQLVTSHASCGLNILAGIQSQCGGRSLKLKHELIIHDLAAALNHSHALYPSLSGSIGLCDIKVAANVGVPG